MQSIKGKTVVVTGASHGIGAAIACAFAREGAKLHLISSPTSKDEAKELSSKCGGMGAASCDCHECDLADPKACDQICSKLGDVDVLVNNAGIFGPSGEEQGPLKGNPSDWDEVIKINLMAPMRLTRAFAPKMKEKGDGYIINIGDVEGSSHITGPHHAVYAASKAGLYGFTMACYENLRDSGIKVVHIAPGNVHGTKMAEATEKVGGQGAIAPEDVAEACMFAFRLSKNAVPSQMEIKAVKPGRVM